MLAYGSTTSPSLKMESGYGNGYNSQRAASFSVGRIIGDPFALATISIGIVSIAYQHPPPTTAHLT
jgi:SHO1 osmosensor